MSSVTQRGYVYTLCLWIVSDNEKYDKLFFFIFWSFSTVVCWSVIHLVVDLWIATWCNLHFLPNKDL